MNVNFPVIFKPVNWFALQIDWLYLMEIVTSDEKYVKKDPKKLSTNINNFSEHLPVYSLKD